MKLGELKKSGLVDEFQRVILLDFDGHKEVELDRGYFSNITNKFDDCEVTISSLCKTRIERHRTMDAFGSGTIAIFVEI